MFSLGGTQFPQVGQEAMQTRLPKPQSAKKLWFLILKDKSKK
jgi:hypothetical protein